MSWYAWHAVACALVLHRAWHDAARQQGLKKQLKKLKAAYEATSATRKLSQHEHPRALSWEASPVQAGTATSMVRSRGPAVADSGGGGAITSIASSSSWRLPMSSSYSLLVGDDVDELEEQFKATLDSEVNIIVHGVFFYKRY